MSNFESHSISKIPEEFAEKRETNEIIPDLISKNPVLKSLKEKGYPVSEAIDNVLDKKQRERDVKNEKIIGKGFQSINNRLNWNLKTSGNEFRWGNDVKYIQRGTDVDNDFIKFNIDDIKDEMRKIFIKKQEEKINFLKEQIGK